MRQQRLSVYVALTTFWVILAGGFSFTLIETLLSFAYLVIIPLALSLVKTEDRQGQTFKSYSYAVRFGPLAAIFGSVAFIFSPSWEGVLLSGVWLANTFLIACYGIVRLAARGFYPLEETAIDVGLIYLAIGGVWQLIYHADYDLMQFGPTIILLTAIHFHYSSFIVPIFAGLLGRLLNAEEQVRIGYKWLAVALMISPMGIAIGITYSRWIEFLFVLLFVVALWRYTWLVFTLKHLKLKEQGKAVLLLRGSALVLLGTMLLSLAYGLGRVLQVSTVSIPDMVVLHGIGNAFGFVLIGLLGWIQIQPKMKGQPYGIPFSQIRGKGKIGSDFLQRSGYVDRRDQYPQGVVEQFSSYNSSTFQGQCVHPLIGEFYEDTLSFELKSKTQWAFGFRFLSRIYAWVSQRIGQLNLLPHGASELIVDSQLVSVDDLQDGRENVRAWVRTERGTQKTIFVALYSQHENKALQETYMNIGLPLPYSQMTGILRLKREEQGLILSSVPRKINRGDEGIYLVTKWLTLRLPLNERFVVRATGSSTLLATHQMWLLGYPFLTINYEIEKKSRQDM